MNRKHRNSSRTLVILAVAAAGCGKSDPEPGPADGFEELAAAVCDPATGILSPDVTNPYFPLPAGLHLVLEGMDDGTRVRVEIDVPGATEEVAGVVTRVMVESEYEDGQMFEQSRNFFAQAPDGTVCYFGEEVDMYSGGTVTGHGGAWRAGENGASPGVIMPGTPRPGVQFAQENAPGVATDMSAVVAVGEPVTVSAGEFADTVETLDWNPLEGQTSADGETKRFARGVGLIVDDVVELIEYEN